MPRDRAVDGAAAFISIDKCLDPEAGALGRWAGRIMAPRFKGKSNFDFSLPCPLCGYKIQPNELMRLTSHIIQCPKCGGAFDELGGRNASTARDPHDGQPYKRSCRSMSQPAIIMRS